MARDFRKILAWQKADGLAFEVYHVTREFPSEELYGGLATQLRAATVAAAVEIADGSARRGEAAFVRSLQQAQSALTAVDYYLSLAQRLGFLDELDYNRLQELRGEAAGLLYGFTSALEQRVREAPAGVA